MTSRSKLKPAFSTMSNLLRKYKYTPGTYAVHFSVNTPSDFHFPSSPVTTKRHLSTQNPSLNDSSTYAQTTSSEFNLISLSDAPTSSSSNGTKSGTKRELPPPITIVRIFYQIPISKIFNMHKLIRFTDCQTPEAVTRVKEILKGKEGEFIGVKIGVKRRKCIIFIVSMFLLVCLMMI